MSNKDQKLFGDALLEALSQKYEKELEICQEDASCSEEHIKKIEQIVKENISENKKQKNFKKKIIALVAAATLLIGTITAYAYREEIKAFIVEMYEKHTRVTYETADESGSDKTITEHYQMGFVPDGYVAYEKEITPILAMYKWRDQNDNIIMFEQELVDNVGYDLDNESGEMSTLNIGEHKLYCGYYKGFYYLWNNGIYSFGITSTVELSDDDLNKIIENINIVS